MNEERRRKKARGEEGWLGEKREDFKERTGEDVRKGDGRGGNRSECGDQQAVKKAPYRGKKVD